MAWKEDRVLHPCTYSTDTRKGSEGNGVDEEHVGCEAPWWYSLGVRSVLPYGCWEALRGMMFVAIVEIVGGIGNLVADFHLLARNHVSHGGQSQKRQPFLA